MSRRSYGIKSQLLVFGIYAAELLLFGYCMVKATTRLHHSHKTGMALFLSPHSIVLQAMVATIVFLLLRLFNYFRESCVRLTVEAGVFRFYSANPFAMPIEVLQSDIEEVLFRADRRNYEFAISTTEDTMHIPVNMTGVTMRNIVDDLSSAGIRVHITGKYAKFYTQDRKLFNRRAFISFGLLILIMLYILFLLIHAMMTHRH